MENFIITVGAAILIYVGIKLALGFLKKNRELDKEKEKTLNDGFSEVENKVRMYRNLRNTELARNRIFIFLSLYIAFIVLGAVGYALYLHKQKAIPQTEVAVYQQQIGKLKGKIAEIRAYKAEADTLQAQIKECKKQQLEVAKLEKELALLQSPSAPLESLWKVLALLVLIALALWAIIRKNSR